MALKEILEFCKVKAISDVLSPTEESIWEDACRTYSQSFHTPLQEVLKMDMEHVFYQNFALQLEEVDVDESVEELLEQVYKIENPDYEAEKEEELQAFIKKVEEDDKKRSKLILKKQPLIPKDAPKSGSVDFSGLKDEG